MKFAYAGNSGTDILTKVGHGLTTGDGPGMGTGCGLDPTADYYVIRLDADTFKLAASHADAIAGTPVINLTSTGNGYFAIGVPYRRGRTYAALSQVKSIDLNGAQDGLEALVAVQSMTFSPLNGVGVGGVVKSVTAVQLPVAAGTSWECTVPIPVGARLRKVTIDGVGNGADDVTVTLAKVRRTVNTVLVAGTAWSNVPALNGSLELVVDETSADAEFAIGEQLYLAFSATNGANVQIHGITPEWLPAWDALP
jgi:hypothetical protein